MHHRCTTVQVTRRAAMAFLAAGLTSTVSAAQQTTDPDARYDGLLRRYVSTSPDGINRVDFAAWKAAAQDRQDLEQYIAQQSAGMPSKLPRAEAFAYWVNLYNAVHMNVVLLHYPVTSFSETPSRDGPWKDKRVTIEGRALSLDEMKGDIMRPTLADPRVHYAVNCASFGCPRLMPRAWRAATLDADLTAAARAFINHPRAVKILPSGDIQVSSIFIWYAADFGQDQAGVVAHLRKYAEPGLAAQLTPTSKLIDGGYDWSLIALHPPKKDG